MERVVHLFGYSAGGVSFSACGTTLLRGKPYTEDVQKAECRNCVRVAHKMTPEQRRAKAQQYDRKHRYKNGPPRRRKQKLPRVWLPVELARVVLDYITLGPSVGEVDKLVDAEVQLRKQLVELGRPLEASTH